MYYVFHTCRLHCRQYHRNSEEVTHFDMIGAETPVVITRPYNPYYGQAGYIKREGICNNTDTPQASHKKYCHANSKQFDMVKVIQPKLCCLFLNWKFMTLRVQFRVLLTFLFLKNSHVEHPFSLSDHIYEMIMLHVTELSMSHVTSKKRCRM